MQSTLKTIHPFFFCAGITEVFLHQVLDKVIVSVRKFTKRYIEIICDENFQTDKTQINNNLSFMPKVVPYFIMAVEIHKAVQHL